VPLYDLHVARWSTPGVRLGRVVKRGLDVVLAMLLLCLLAPVFALIAVAIKATSPGPVFFRQTRLGRGCVPFSILKFRTMAVGAEARLVADADAAAHYVEAGYKVPPGAETRTTRVGGCLRRIALDELPQLVHVVSGRMSLVGPRPVVVPEIEEYGPWRWAYAATRPGMTGAWQVTGRGRIVYPERALLDARYVAHWSLRSDVWILAQTLPAVIRGEARREVSPLPVVDPR
jgi:lipopolysaccharide/colanic/teichoic acid biosynthesis glycosyltransferase